jgi:transposase
VTNRSHDSVGSRMEPVSIEYDLLSDEQWSLISHLFPKPKPHPRGGRPSAETRRCLEGILWVLRTGARWKDLPRSFPSYVTCWRRFVAWSRSGLWEQIWSYLVHRLDDQGKVDWEAGMADGTFASAKKGVIV